MGSPVSQMGGQMAGGPIPAQQAMAYRRSSPYGNARQVMLQRRQQYAAAAAAVGPGGMTPAMNHVSISLVPSGEHTLSLVMRI